MNLVANGNIRHVVFSWFSPTAMNIGKSQNGEATGSK